MIRGIESKQPRRDFSLGDDMVGYAEGEEADFYVGYKPLVWYWIADPAAHFGWLGERCGL